MTYPKKTWTPEDRKIRVADMNRIETGIAEVEGEIAAAGPGSYAPVEKGVTNGDYHDHAGGDGAAVPYGSLSGAPSLGNAAAKNVGSGSGDVSAGDHGHGSAYAAASHNHDDSYSPTGHNHDSSYAAAGHDHSGIYSPANHDHDSAYVAKNAAITGAAKCKVTYDAKGLVTSGADLGSGDIPDISATYATAAKGVTNGDSHDHDGGDGAQIAYGSLSSPPSLGDAAAKNTGTGAGEVAAGNHAHGGVYAPVANGVSNGDSHDHLGGDGAQIAHTSLSSIGTSTHAQIDTHIAIPNPIDLSAFRRTGSTRERWYTRPLTHTAQTTSGAVTSGRLYAIPFFVPRTITLDRIAINVTTLVASGKARVGIYTDSNGEPGSLVAGTDVAELDTSATGVKASTVSVTLTAGSLYWLAVLFNNATNVVRGAAVAGMIDVLGSDNTLPTAAVTHLYVAQAYGALPASFGTPTNGTGTSPLVFVRLSA